MTSVADELAGVAASAYGRPLPPASQAAGKRLLINAAALAPLGHRHPVVETIVGAWPPAPKNTKRPIQSPLTLARATGAAINVDDYDDAQIDTLIHPACVNLAAAAAVASLKPVTGSELLTAFVVGCEVELRLASALLPEALERGWDLNGVCGTVSAAVTASLLLDPSPARVANAMGIAASSTLGMLGAAGSALKVYTVGKAAENGVGAALLAGAQFTAPRDCFDSPRGLCQALIQRPDAFDEAASGFPELGALADTVVKRYPCAIVLHPFIDAMCELRPTHPQGGSITAFCSPRVFRLVDRPSPVNGLEAKLSAQFCLAAALRDGALEMSHFEDGSVAEMQPLTAQISLVADPAVSSDQATIESTPASGAQGAAPGRRSDHGLRDATDDELRQKVDRVLNATSLGDQERHRYVDQLTNIDGAAELQSLVDVVTNRGSDHG